MGKSREFTTGFDAGFVDPEYRSREDLESYRNSLSQCDNFEISYAGSLRKRRPIERLTATLGPQVSTDVGIRIETFRFDEDNTWLVEFDTAEGGLIRIRDTSMAEVAKFNGLGWITATTIAELDYDQLLDTAIMTHPSWGEPKVIRRDGSSWSLPLFEFTDRAGSPANGFELYQKPWYKFQDTLHVYLKPSVWDGSGFMNAYINVNGVLTDYDLFDTPALQKVWRWRGQHFRITATPNPPTNQADIVTLEPFTRDVRLYLTQGIPTAADQFAVGEYVRGAQTGATGWVTAKDTGANNSVDIEIEQGVFKAPTSNPPGDLPNPEQSEELESLQDPSKRFYIQWKDSNVAPSASLDWDEPAWSVARGGPGAVAFHGGRLWFAATTELPNFVWSSKALDFFNFDVGTGSADDSVQYPIIKGGVSRIHHLISAQHLCIFTDSAEYWVPETPTQPITPGSFAPRLATNYGSRKSMKPFLMAGDPVYAQQQGQVLRRFYYDARIRENYVSPIISAWASSLIDSPVRGAFFGGRSERGEQNFYLINGTRQIVQATIFPDDRMAYSTMTPAKGSVKDPDPSDPVFLWATVTDSDIYFITQEGSWRFIDRIVPEYKDVALLDEGRTYTSGTPTNLFTVHADYANKDVDVVGWDENEDIPCYYLGQYPVSGTTLDLFSPIWKKITVGYAYNSSATMVPLNVIARDGHTRMIPKGLVSFAPQMVETYSLTVQGQSFTAAQLSPTLPPIPINGQERRWVLGYSNDIQIQLGSFVPLACEIAAITTELDY